MSATATDNAGVAQAAAATPVSGVASAASGRFEYIDGLRGIASMMVVIGHLADAAEDKHPGILGPGVIDIADFGRYGVQIFFVLSGFVIAHSVSAGAYSFGYLGRFVGRRFVRLDLPYWSVIAMEVCLLWLSGMVAAQFVRELPSFSQIAANAFYVQSFVGEKHILPVFWTLCYEVQFYLVFVLSLVLLTKLREAGASQSATRTLGATALGLSFCWSLSIYLGLLPTPHQALFVDRWFQFGLGVITYLYYRNLCSWVPVVAALALCGFGGAIFGHDAYRTTSTLFTVATSIAILASLRFSWWNSLLIGPGVQFLGRISYSLYLLHVAIGWRATVVVREVLGAHYTTLTAYLAFFVGVGVSVLGSWIMYLLIEGPAIKLARRIRLPQRRVTAPG